jgi:hypothetical protein
MLSLKFFFKKKNLYNIKMSQDNNICNDQKSFNLAFKKAMEEHNTCKTQRCKKTMCILGLIMLILYIYAILLALKVEDKKQRIVHMVFALTTGPIYILAYYLAMF